MRCVLFGVDGLTFRVLHPLMARGDLPHFRKLAEQGCEAILESRYPPLTPPAWTSLSTGLKPARHGVYDFWMYEDRQDGKRTTRVQTKRKGGKAIWNILSEFRKEVLVVNVPVTYPPDAVNGIMISGYMTPGNEVDFTYPVAFKEELYRVVPDYQIDLDLHNFFRQPKAMERLIDVTLVMTERRIKLITYLLKEKPWDFCYLAFVGPDRLQHSLWEEITSLDSRAIEYFHMLDHALGLVLEQLGPDDILFVFSDHGFQGVQHVFNINEFLRLEGVLKSASVAKIQQANRSATLKQLARRMGLLGLARKTKRALKHAGALHVPHSDVYHPLLDQIDVESSYAYVPSLSGYPGSYADIFLTEKMGAEDIAQLCANLRKEVDPHSGKALVEALYTNEVFGEGPYAPPEPHLLLLPNDGITIRMNIGGSQVWDETSKVRGTHQKDGVLYAYGGGIKRGFKAPNAEVYDLVPTALHSMNLPLPHTFDGRVLHELFEEQKRDEVTGEVGAMEKASAPSRSDGGLVQSKLKKLLAK